MRGKVGLVIGLAAGYVLGTRAGRERYEQIKAQAEKVWNLDPVQEQVDKVKGFAKSTAMALPNALWDGAVKVTKAVQQKGTPGQKLDGALQTAKDSADEVKEGAETTLTEAKKAAEEALDELAKSTKSDAEDGR